MAANSQFAVAVHILTMLAKDPEQYVKSDLIAASVNTNPVVIRRLLVELGQADLVVSQTGAAGGTRLARPADKISLTEVFKAVSRGEVFALHQRGPNRDCPVGRNIEAVLCCMQKAIDASICKTLSKYTLQSVIDMVESGEAGEPEHR
ncbi:MAG: Rrf2 family transcriptional regulator [Pyrinomonadaceae bacterium]